MALKRSPLLEEHQKLSAKLVEFAGWEMPISYPTGTLSEHDECRNACVMFDVSHLGSVLLEGEGLWGIQVGNLAGVQQIHPLF